VSLWQQYLSVAQRTGAPALAGRIAARAVQLHPRTPALYVLAAAHELAQGGMAAARALLQRGLRLNAGSSVELWREYVRLELGFVEGVRRRWDVLGISLRDDNEESGRGLGVDVDLGGQGQDKNDRGGQGERVDRAEEQVMGDSARRAIMDGAIVRQAIDSAAKGKPPGYVPPRTHLTLLLLSRYSHVMSLDAGGTLTLSIVGAALPTIELFQNLQSFIAGYPAAEALRSSLLDHLHTRLIEALPRDAAAVTLRATRRLALASAEDPAGGSLVVDALRDANEVMLTAMDADVAEEGPPRDELARAYAEFVEQWCGKEDVDAHLVRTRFKTTISCSLRSHGFCGIVSIWPG